MQASTTTLKKILKLLKNLNIDLPYDLAIPFLGIYPKECDSGNSRATCTHMFIASLFNNQVMETAKIAPLLMNGLRTCCIYTQWNFMQP
jgi:hypothetical protein